MENRYAVIKPFKPTSARCVTAVGCRLTSRCQGMGARRATPNLPGHENAVNFLPR